MESKESKKENKPNNFSPTSGFLVILITFIFWVNLGPLLSFGILSIDFFKDSTWSGVGDYLIVHAPYLLMFIALLLGSNLLLKTKLRELITGSGRQYRWKFSIIVAFVYTLFLVLISLFQIKTISINDSSFLDKAKFILPVLLLTPMQALSEELFFRALPARIVYKNQLPKDIKNSIAIILISGLLFLIPHMGNPEFNANMLFSGLYYFLWGSLAMALGIYTDGFEAPVAMHIANNLYIALFVNYSNSSIPTQAIFINREESSSIFSVIEVMVVFSILLYVSYLIKKKKPQLLEGRKHGKD